MHFFQLRVITWFIISVSALMDYMQIKWRIWAWWLCLFKCLPGANAIHNNCSNPEVNGGSNPASVVFLSHFCSCLFPLIHLSIITCCLLLCMVNSLGQRLFFFFYLHFAVPGMTESWFPEQYKSVSHHKSFHRDKILIMHPQILPNESIFRTMCTSDMKIASPRNNWGWQWGRGGGGG